MITNTEIILKIARVKGFTKHQIYKGLNECRAFKYACARNEWSEQMVTRVGKLIGEDLLIYANARCYKNGRNKDLSSLQEEI